MDGPFINIEVIKMKALMLLLAVLATGCSEVQWELSDGSRHKTLQECSDSANSEWKKYYSELNGLTLKCRPVMHEKYKAL